MLADYAVNKSNDMILDVFLEKKIFADREGTTLEPNPADVEGFEKFTEIYKANLSVEQEAICRLH